MDGLLRHHLAFTAQDDGNFRRTEPAGGDDHVDGDLVAHEREVVDGYLFHRQVLQRLGTDGKDEHGRVQPAQLRGRGRRDALRKLGVVRPIARDEETGQRAAAGSAGCRRVEGPEDVGGRTLRIGGKPAQVGRLQLLVESVDVHLEASGELRQVRLVLHGPALQLFRARGPGRRCGKFHRAAGIEEQRHARPHAAFRAQLDAGLEQQHEDEERRNQAEGEQRDPAPSGRLGAEAAEREPDRGGQRGEREREEPRRQRRERGDAPGVVGALGNLQILRRFMMKGM